MNAPRTERKITNSDLERAIETLARRINSAPGGGVSGVVGIAQGGVIPARMISGLLKVPLIGNIRVQRYDQSNIPMPARLIEIDDAVFQLDPKKLLVIDDIAGSGSTLRLTIEHLGEVAIAVPFSYPGPVGMLRKDGVPLINFYGEIVSEDCWLTFPWECSPREEFADSPQRDVGAG